MRPNNSGYSSNATSSSSSTTFFDSPSSSYSPNLKSGATSQEFEIFLEDYSQNGLHCNDGTVLNLEDNPKLKVGETEDLDFSHSASEMTTSTRAAFKVTDLSKDKEDTLRVKFINYGNYNAMCEVEAAHIYRLAGMAAPQTQFLIHKAYPRRENGAPQVLIASPMITGYSDLGDFFISPVVDKFIQHQKIEVQQEVRILQQRILDINEKSKDVITAEDKIERIRLMKKIYNYLPDYFHQEIEKAFAASKLVNNWDFANLSLNNIGCKWTLDNNKVVKFESAFVDFGNSGPIGFGGKVKERSLARANTEAKIQLNKPRDYDPAIAFTEIESKFIEEKGGVLPIAKELAEEESRIEKTLSAGEINFRRKIISKEAHHIRPSEANFQIASDMIGMLSISDLPRNFAFGFLLEPAIKAKSIAANKIICEAIDEVDSLKDAKTDLSRSIFRDSEIEMAYRFSLIKDEAIDAVIDKWHLQKDFPETFPTPEDLDPERYCAEGVKNIYKERRNFLANSVPKEVVEEWIYSHPAQAINAEYSVMLASLEEVQLTDIPSTTSETSSSATRGATKIQIFYDIQNKELEISNLSCTEYPEVMETLRGKMNELTSCNALIEQLNQLEQSPVIEGAKDALLQKKDNLKTVIDQKKLELTVNFITNNIENWKRDYLGLEDMPNCNPLDIERLRKIYRAQPQLNSKARKGIAFDEENHARNADLHQENIFILRSVTEILDRMSAITHPATTPLNRSHGTQHRKLAPNQIQEI